MTFLLTLLFLFLLSCTAWAKASDYGPAFSSAPSGTAASGPGVSGRQIGPAAAAGWQKEDEVSWKYLENGAPVVNSWKEINGNWYYFNSGGYMLLGWQNIGGAWYYLTPAADETHPLGSCWISGTTPDGHPVNETGVLTDGTPPAQLASRRGNPFGYSCIEVDITNQSVFCYVNNDLRVATLCVTGANGRSTSAGHFVINYKERNRYLQGTNADGSKYKSWVNYWMPFNGGQGLHDATWRKAFGGQIYKTGGSHGCVNMPLAAAEQIYGIAWVGMPVIVHY